MCQSVVNTMYCYGQNSLPYLLIFGDQTFWVFQNKYKYDLVAIQSHKQNLWLPINFTILTVLVQFNFYTIIWKTQLGFKFWRKFIVFNLGLRLEKINKCWQQSI